MEKKCLINIPTKDIQVRIPLALSILYLTRFSLKKATDIHYIGHSICILILP